MSLEVYSDYRKSESIEEQCRAYLSYHVILVIDEINSIDGIIQGVNKNEIILLAGEDINTENMRQGNRFRRYRPRNVPINRIGGIFPVPYPIIPVPYPVPYPFYPI